MKLHHYIVTLALVFVGGCLSTTRSTEVKRVGTPEKSHVSQESHSETDCKQTADCSQTEYCFQHECVTASEEMTCSLPDVDEVSLECIFTVDADGDNTEEVLRITRNLEERKIDIDIMDTKTLQTKHFEVTTDNVIGNSPLVELSVISKEVAGIPLLVLDVPGVEACDSSSNKYHLSYSSNLGIQEAIGTFHTDGEVGSTSSTVEFYPNGTAKYTYTTESHGGDFEEERHEEGPQTQVYRKCFKKGTYVNCSASEVPIKVDLSAPPSKGFARLKGVPTKICNECEGCESEDVCATHHDFPKCFMQPCCDGSIEREGACSICPQGTIPDAAQKNCIPQ